MNSTGKKNEKTGSLVILLLVVGLTGFSSSMKELNEVRQLLFDTSRLVAQSSDRVAPTEIAHIAIKKIETCEDKNLQQSAPSVELPWLAEVNEETDFIPAAPRPAAKLSGRKFVPVPSVKPAAPLLAELQKLRRFEFDAKQFEVVMSTEHNDEPDALVTSDFPVMSFKTRTRKHSGNRINPPRDREVILKTLNRTINLRIAS